MTLKINEVFKITDREKRDLAMRRNVLEGLGKFEGLSLAIEEQKKTTAEDLNSTIMPKINKIEDVLMDEVIPAVVQNSERLDSVEGWIRGEGKEMFQDYLDRKKGIPTPSQGESWRISR